MSHLYAASALILFSLPNGFAVPLAQELPVAGLSLPPLQLFSGISSTGVVSSPTTGDVSVQTDPIALAASVLSDVPVPVPTPADVSSLTGGVLTSPLEPNIGDGTFSGVPENELSSSVPILIPLESPVVEFTAILADPTGILDIIPTAVPSSKTLDLDSFSTLVQEIADVISGFFDIYQEYPEPGDPHMLDLGPSRIRRHMQDTNTPETSGVKNDESTSAINDLFIPLLETAKAMLKNIPGSDTASSQVTPKEALSYLEKRDHIGLDQTQTLDIMKQLLNMAQKLIVSVSPPNSPVTNAIPNLGSLLGGILKRDLSALEPDTAIDLFKKVLDILSGLVENLPHAGDTTKPVTPETIRHVANGLGKRQFSLKPNDLVQMLKQMLNVAKAMAESIPTAGIAATKVILDNVVSNLSSVSAASSLSSISHSSGLSSGSLPSSVLSGSLPSSVPSDSLPSSVSSDSLPSSISSVPLSSNLPVVLLPSSVPLVTLPADLPVVNDAVNDVPLDTLTNLDSLGSLDSLIGGLGKAKRGAEALPLDSAEISSLLKTLLQLVTTIASTVTDAVPGPLDALTNPDEGLHKEKRQLGEWPLSSETVASILQDAIQFAKKLTASFPKLSDIISKFPVDTDSGVHSGQDKRDTLTQEQQHLIAVANAKHTALQKAIDQLEAIQQSHLTKREKKLPIDIRPVANLIPTVVSVLGMIMRIVNEVPIIPALTNTIPFDPAALLSEALSSDDSVPSGRSQKRQVATSSNGLTGLLSSVASGLAALPGITTSIPVVHTLTGALPVTPVAVLGGVNNPLTSDSNVLLNLLKKILPFSPVALIGALGNTLNPVTLLTGVGSTLADPYPLLRDLGLSNLVSPRPNPLTTGLNGLTSTANPVNSILGVLTNPASGNVVGSLLGGLTNTASGNPVSSLTGTLGSLGGRSGDREVAAKLDPAAFHSLLGTVTKLLGTILKLIIPGDVKVPSKPQATPIPIFSNLPGVLTPLTNPLSTNPLTNPLMNVLTNPITNPLTNPLANIFPNPILPNPVNANPPTVVNPLPVDLTPLTNALPDNVLPLVSALPEALAPLASAIPNILAPLASALPQVLGSLTDALPEDFFPFLSDLPTSLDDLPDGILPLMNAVPGILAPLADALPGALAPLADALPEALAPLADVLPEVLAPVASALAPLASELPGVLAPLASGLPDVLASLASGLPEALAPFASALAPLASELPEALAPLASAVPEALAPLASALAPLASGLPQALAPVASALAPLASGLPQALAPLASALAPLASGLPAAVAPVASALVPLASGIPAAVAPVASALAPLASGIPAAVAPVASALAPLASGLPKAAAPVASALAPVASALAPLTNGLLTSPLLKPLSLGSPPPVRPLPSANSVPAGGAPGARGGTLSVRQSLGGLGGLGGLGSIANPAANPLAAPLAAVAAPLVLAVPASSIAQPALTVLAPANSALSNVVPSLSVARSAVSSVPAIPSSAHSLSSSIRVPTPVLSVATPAVAVASPIRSAAAPVLGAALPLLDTLASVVGVVSPVQSTPTPVVAAASPVRSSAAPILSVAPLLDTLAPLLGLVSPALSVSKPVLNNVAPVQSTTTPIRSAATPATSAVNIVAPILNAVASILNAATTSISAMDTAVPILKGAITAPEPVATVLDSSIPVLDVSPLLLPAQLATTIANTVFPLGDIQNILELVNNILAVPDVQTAVTKRDISALLENRQAISKPDIKNFVNVWRTVGPSLSAVSPALTEGLMEEMLNPSGSPPTPTYLKKYPQVMRPFVVEFFIVAELLSGANVSKADKVDMLRVMFNASLEGRPGKRNMRHGLRRSPEQSGLTGDVAPASGNYANDDNDNDNLSGEQGIDAHADKYAHASS